MTKKERWIFGQLLCFAKSKGYQPYWCVHIYEKHFSKKVPKDWQKAPEIMPSKEMLELIGLSQKIAKKEFVANGCTTSIKQAIGSWRSRNNIPG